MNLKLEFLNIQDLVLKFGASATNALHNKSENNAIAIPWSANLHHTPENGGAPIVEWILQLFPNCPQVNDIPSVYMHWEYITIIEATFWICLSFHSHRFYITFEDFEELFEFRLHPYYLTNFVEEVKESIASGEPS